MPALLSRLDGEDVAAIDEGGPNGGVPTMRPQVLNSLQAKVSHRRRRSRMVLSAVAAATAAVLVIGTFITMRPSGPIPGPPPPAAEVSGLTMTPVMSSELSATVTLSSYSWGTRIDMNCTYGVDNSDHESDSQGRRQAGDGGGGSRRQPQSGGDLGGASRRDRLTRRQHLHPGRSDRRHPGSVYRDARHTPATESVNSHPTASDHLGHPACHFREVDAADHIVTAKRMKAGGHPTSPKL
jgi:hypothetical protein